MTMFPIMSDDIFLKPTLEEGRNIYLILGTRSTTFLFQATFIERNLEKNRILHATTIPSNLQYYFVAP